MCSHVNTFLCGARGSDIISSLFGNRERARRSCLRREADWP